MTRRTCVADPDLEGSTSIEAALPKLDDPSAGFGDSDLFSGLTMSPQPGEGAAQAGKPDKNLTGLTEPLEGVGGREEGGLDALDADEDMLNALSLHDPKSGELSRAEPFSQSFCNS